MNKKAIGTRFLITAACLLNVVSPQAINVTSTWISGTSTANAVSVVGTTGVPSTTIYPGGRIGPCMAMTNQDSNYKLYLYGGQGYATATLNYLRDFWVLRVSTMEWTMLPQNSVNTASLGTRGFESASTFPGTLGRMSCLINPRDNYLYMFGGVTGARFNDMWRYNPTSGYWAWLGGGTSTTPTLNVESSTIFPTTRRNTAMVAHPTLNILIIASGFGADLNGNAGDVNDMWRFNLDTNAWTWFAGSVSALAVPTVFDTKGAATAANFPGGRNMHTTYMNPTTVIMYLFGGITGTGAPYFNDMWSYDYAAGMWTWISGGTSNNQVPVYGASGVFDASYTPGARGAATFSKVYGTTYLSLYGGRGYGVNSAAYNAYLNEMWFFDYSTNQWAWIVGSNEANTYGTKGVTSSGPYPQGRNLHASSSMAFNQSLIIFGGLAGSTTNYMGDTWKLDFSSLSPASTSSSVEVASSTSSAISVATSSIISVSTASAATGTSSSVSSSSDTNTASASSVSSATDVTISSASITDSVLPTASSTDYMVSTGSDTASISQAGSSSGSATVSPAPTLLASQTTQLSSAVVPVTSSKLASSTASSTASSSATRSSSSSSSSFSKSASVTTSTTSSGAVQQGTSTRSSSSSSSPIASSSKAATTTAAVVITAVSSLKSSSTKLIVTSKTSTTQQATSTPAGSGDTAALSDNSSGSDSIFAQPAVIAALVAVVILAGILLIKVHQRNARRNNFSGGGGGKNGGGLDQVLTSMHHVALPDTASITTTSRLSYSSDYAQMPTQTSMARSEQSQQPPPQTMLLYGNLASQPPTMTYAQKSTHAPQSATLMIGNGTNQAVQEGLTTVAADMQSVQRSAAETQITGGSGAATQLPTSLHVAAEANIQASTQIVELEPQFGTDSNENNSYPQQYSNESNGYPQQYANTSNDFSKQFGNENRSDPQQFINEHNGYPQQFASEYEDAEANRETVYSNDVMADSYSAQQDSNVLKEGDEANAASPN